MKVVNRKPKNKKEFEFPRPLEPVSTRISDLENLFRYEMERNISSFIFHNPIFVPWWNDFHDLYENSSNE